MTLQYTLSHIIQYYVIIIQSLRNNKSSKKKHETETGGWLYGRYPSAIASKPNKVITEVMPHSLDYDLVKGTGPR